MAIALEPVLQALETLVYEPPARVEESLALINDQLRSMGLSPLGKRDFDQLSVIDEALVSVWGFVAFALRATAFGASLERERCEVDSLAALEFFVLSAAGLPVAALAKNAFRREEVLRKWCSAFQIAIEGESTKQSAERLDAVDFQRLKKVMEREAESRRALAFEAAKKKAAEEAARLKALEAQRGTYE